MAGGFLVGLIVAATVRSGFWTAQLYATGVVAVLTLSVAIAVVVLKDDGPQIDGEQLVLETELRLPRDWKPDNYARYETGSGCFLQTSGANESPDIQPGRLWTRKYVDLHPMYRRGVLGDLTLNAPPEQGGPWTISCAVELRSTTWRRYIRVYAGHRTDVTFQVPLPRHPNAAFEQWSGWNANEFVPQAGKAVPADIAFRFRVRRKTEYDAANAVESEADKAAKMPPDAPLADWLPFFESRRGGGLRYYEVPTQAIEAVKAHAAELQALLRSNDRDVAIRSVYATIVLHPIPPDLIGPLADSGRNIIVLIRDARARSLPDDPDLVGEQKSHQLYASWSEAMQATGAAGIPAYREILDEIIQEVRNETGEGGIHDIAAEAARDLSKLDKGAQ